MAATSFVFCEKTVLAFEGGKVDHPNDPSKRAAIIERLRQLGIAF
jgi:lysozyme family protein